MVSLTTCPCCGDPLLHCIRRGEAYRFCSSCWLEFPALMPTRQRASAAPLQSSGTQTAGVEDDALALPAA